MGKCLLFFSKSLLILIILVTAGLPNLDGQAAGVVGTGTPASCTETALVAALAGGGTVSFNCDGAATIPFTSTKTIFKNTTIQGNGIITLDGGGTVRLFILPALTTLTLNDITLNQGNAGNGDGGAIEGSGTINLSNVIIQNSQTNAGFCGGAIATDVTGVMNITNSTFQMNTGGSGGAICTGGSLHTNNSKFLFNRATDNTAIQGSGGAIYLFPTGVMDFDEGEINGNSAVLGGGIYLSGTAKATLHSSGQPLSISANSATDSGGAINNDAGILVIDHAFFVGNSAPMNNIGLGYGGAIADHAGMTLSNSSFLNNQGRFGGAVFVGNSSVTNPNATISHVIFAQNIAGIFGGGLYADTFNTTVKVTDTVFTLNQAVAGGGLARFNAMLTVSDSSATNNTATTYGGGVYIGAGPTANVGGYVEIRDSTIAANTAPQGGGLYNNAEVDLGNVTLVNNTNGIFTFGTGAITRIYNVVLQNPNTLNCDGDGTLPSSAGGNYSTDNSCGLSSPTDRQGIGLDPKLGPLVNDGQGTTFYELPMANSPLINAAVPPCSTTDQRHAIRPDACDIGAVEYGGGRSLTFSLWWSINRYLLPGAGLFEQGRLISVVGNGIDCGGLD